MKRSYSLIFMTDQGKTSRVRIGSGTLRFIIILCITLPLLLGGTLWAGWELLQRYSALRAENAALSAKLTEQSDIITRLGNLEQFLRAADPELLQQVLGPTRTALENAVPTNGRGKKDAGTCRWPGGIFRNFRRTCGKTGNYAGVPSITGGGGSGHRFFPPCRTGRTGKG